MKLTYSSKKYSKVTALTLSIANLNSDNILDKVLDSEKLIDETSRFREVSRE